MARISIKLSRYHRHWEMEINVNGKVEPRNVFGCSQAMEPLIAGLLATEAQDDRVRARADGHADPGPAVITVTMPSGRVLTFTLTSVQESFTDLPQGIPAVSGLPGAR